MLSQSPKLSSLSTKYLISAILGGVLSLSGCKKEGHTQQPEVATDAVELKADNVSENKIKKVAASRSNCQLLFNDIIALKRKADDLSSVKEKINSIDEQGESEGRPYQFEEILAPSWLETNQTLLKALSWLNECKFNDNLKQQLSNLENLELVDLMRTIDGASEFMAIAFYKGIDVDELDARDATTEKPNEALIMNAAFEVIFGRGLKDDEFNQFLDLAHLIQVYPDKVSYLSEENILKFRIILLAGLRKAFDQNKDLSSDAIFGLKTLGEEGAGILFDFIEISTDTTKVKTALVHLSLMAEELDKIALRLQKYLWSRIKSTNLNEETRAFMIRMIGIVWGSTQLPLIDKENIPYLMELIKKDTSEISSTALWTFSQAKNTGLVKPNQLKEIEKILIERSNKKDNDNACFELGLVNEWNQNASTELGELRDRICEATEFKIQIIEKPKSELGQM